MFSLLPYWYTDDKDKTNILFVLANCDNPMYTIHFQQFTFDNLGDIYNYYIDYIYIVIYIYTVYIHGKSED